MVLADSWRIVFFKENNVRLTKENIAVFIDELKDFIQSRVKEINFDNDSLLFGDDNFYGLIVSDDELRNVTDIKETLASLNKAICAFADLKKLSVIFEVIAEIADESSYKLASYAINVRGHRSYFSTKTKNETLSKLDVDRLVSNMCKNFLIIPWDLDSKGAITQKGRKEKFDIEMMFMKSLFYYFYKSETSTKDEDDSEEEK